MSIENVIKNTKYEIPEGYLEKVQGARNIFLKENTLKEEEIIEYKQLLS